MIINISKNRLFINSSFPVNKRKRKNFGQFTQYFFLGKPYGSLWILLCIMFGTKESFETVVIPMKVLP